MAGLFEGEGCLSVRAGLAQFAITSSDYDVLERLQEFTQVGAIYKQTPAKKHYKLSYKWTVGKQADVWWLIEKIEPYLGKRRRQRIALARKQCYRPLPICVICDREFERLPMSRSKTCSESCRREYYRRWHRNYYQTVVK